jgi:hypothetical protein
MTITNWKTGLLTSGAVAGGLLAGGLVLRALLQRRRSHAAAIHFDPAEASAAVASRGGIMDIDPEPITQMAGEGIDPDQRTSRVQGLENILEHAPPARLA